MNNIENIQEYIPTVYVNDSEPDLDETNLNKTEQAIKRVTDAANKAIDALKQLDREKLALSAISNVLSDATDKVPSLALANTMQLAINDLNSNLGDSIFTKDFSKSTITINGGGVMALKYDVGVSGYIPLGIILDSIVNSSDSGINSSACSMYSQTIVGNVITLIIKNISSDTAIADVSIRCLYVKQK